MNKRGFTLIEVVVVMAIIAVLAVLVTGAINIVRRQARDTKRLNDMKTLETALIAYKTKTGSWPENGDATAYISCPTPTGCWCALGTDDCLKDLTDSGVLPSLPEADLSYSSAAIGGRRYYYYFKYSWGVMISTFMENPQMGPGKKGYRCNWATPADDYIQPYCINIEN